MKLITTASALALVAAPAFAGGMAEPVMTVEPVAAPAPVMMSGDWSGGYVGAELGYGWAQLDDGTDDVDAEGALGGLFAGYQADLGQWVVGGEASYDWADIGVDDSDAKIDQIGRLKLKAGYDLGQVLVYGTAGAAYANFDDGAGDDLNDWGWLAGLGMDYKVTEAITVGAEVLYHQFDDFDDTGIDVDATTLQARVAYNF